MFRSPLGIKVTWAYAVIMTIIVIVLLIVIGSRSAENFYAEERDIAVQTTQTVARSIQFMITRQNINGGWVSVALTSQVVVAMRLAAGIDPSLLRLFNNTPTTKDYLTKAIQQNLFLLGTATTPTPSSVQTITQGELAYIMLALRAMCVNTTQFANVNLNQQMVLRLQKFELGFNQRYPYALGILALCLNNYKVSQKIASAFYLMQDRDGSWLDVDTTSLGIMALNCVGGYTGAIQSGIHWLLKQQDKKTFLFGNEYSTSHAIHALLSAKVPVSTWNYPKVLQALFQMRKYDGSFGRVDNTAAVLPSLTGSTFFDLKTITCKPPSGAINSSVVTIVYAIRYRCPNYVSIIDASSLTISAQAGSSMITFMKIAAGMSSAFNYTLKYHATFDAYTVETINGISDSTSNNVCRWFLQYDLTKKLVPLGVSHFKPKNNDELSFVYRKSLGQK